jgi:glycosyltransferase involved in cell wall biosynthesis
MLTVLLATRNRAQVLRQVLEAYCKLRAPASGWKLVIVDNGSTDETSQVVASFIRRLPVQCIVEHEMGKNRALNTGLALAEGELTVLTDDDAFPNADWLIELQRAAEAQPTCSIFGGAIVPRWEATPPEWVQWIDPRPVYTLTDPSLEEGPLSPGLVFGPNMAIRTDVFRAGARFDIAMGPRGSNYPMGSETELVQRLARLGHEVWFVPSAVVEHFIRKEQLTELWVLERAVRYGRGKYRLAHMAETSSRNRWIGTEPRLFRRLLRECLVMTAARMTFRQEAFFRSRWHFNYWRGQMAEARILARGQRNETPW